MTYGVSSMTEPLRRVALRAPGPSLLGAVPNLWHYSPHFDPSKVKDCHAEFVNLLDQDGIELLWMGGDDKGIADAVFTFDASLMTPKGAILMKPGKALRRGESEFHSKFYAYMDIPVIGAISGEARAEAGDMCWLDQETLAIGRGFRTNEAGINQMKTFLEPMGVRVHAFDLPFFQGEFACLHLLSLISPVDTRTALIASSMIPVGLWQLLRELDFSLIEVPGDEYEESATLCANILATSPGRCIMIDGFPKTRKALEASGTEVRTFEGRALCMGCEGGPTCLTRPILRA